MCSSNNNLLTELLPGDLFLTRNRLRIHNLTPGYYNHVAVYSGCNIVIEAQVGQGIIHTNLTDFINRYPVITVVRYKDGEFNYEAAAYARNFVGKGYKKWASFFKILLDDGTDNCVSLVRRIYTDITGGDPLWKIPDDIIQDSNIKEIYKK